MGAKTYCKSAGINIVQQQLILDFVGLQIKQKVYNVLDVRYGGSYISIIMKRCFFPVLNSIHRCTLKERTVDILYCLDQAITF